MRRHGLCIPHAEAELLSEVATTSTDNVWKDRSFVNTKELVHYADASELEWSVKIVEARTKVIDDDRQSSYYLLTRNLKTCNWYGHFTNLGIDTKDFLELLESLNGDHTSQKSLGISNVENSDLLVSEPKDSLLLVKVASFSVTNLTKTATLYAPSFYSATRTVLVEPHEL